MAAEPGRQASPTRVLVDTSPDPEATLNLIGIIDSAGLSVRLYTFVVTADKTVKWLEAQGFRIRRFGPQINAAYGETTPDEHGIRLAGRVMAQITPEKDGRWTLWDHSRVVRCFDEFDQAVHALRDYLIEKEQVTGRPHP